MADFYGHFNNSGGGMAALDGEDFQEEEVWAMVKASREGSNSNYPKTRKNLSGSSSSAWRSAATSRSIPRSTSGGGAGGGNPEFSTAPNQSSAPVNVPDWSKILKKPPVKRNLWDDDDACDDGDGGSDHHVKVDESGGGGVDDGDDDIDRVPPHEYLARRLARTQIASFSMCEGVGRTLKGRDLSNLRNAILTKTGFIE